MQVNLNIQKWMIVFNPTKRQADLGQPAFTCSKSKIETPEQCLKSVQS